MIIVALIGCFRSKLSDFTFARTKVCNGTGQFGQFKQPIKIERFVPLANEH